MRIILLVVKVKQTICNIMEMALSLYETLLSTKGCVVISETCFAITHRKQLESAEDPSEDIKFSRKEIIFMQ